MTDLRNPLPYIVICAVLVMVTGCETNTFEPDPTPEVVSFDEDVMPIMGQSCVACHRAEDDPPPLLTEDVAYQEIMSGGYVIPGDPDESLFYIRLHGDPDIRGGRTMPPAEKLPEHEIALVRAWIEQGAQNN